MFGRVPKNGAVFLGTRPNISESHSERSTRVPICIEGCCLQARRARPRQTSPRGLPPGSCGAAPSTPRPPTTRHACPAAPLRKLSSPPAPPARPAPHAAGHDAVRRRGGRCWDGRASCWACRPSTPLPSVRARRNTERGCGEAVFDSALRHTQYRGRFGL